MHQIVKISRLAVCISFSAWIAGSLPANCAAYDPLRLAGQSPGETVELEFLDADRQRPLPLLVYLPATQSPAPTLLFSHGLGGSRHNNPYLGEHWAARGYVAVFLQHPGSDDSVWRSQPVAQRYAAMNRAASGQNFLLRVRDVAAVLDQLEEWNETEDHSLAGRLDLDRVGMSGHSFGAVTTQSVSGQRRGRRELDFTDSRIKAAVAFSPSSPRQGSPDRAFGEVEIPWLLMTGTRDVVSIGNKDLESRLAVFPALPPGGKYELVLHEAEHSAFGSRSLPGETGGRNPNHHRAILALSTAFWDAWLLGNSEAKAWLHGQGPRSVLEEKDRWQRK